MRHKPSFRLLNDIKNPRVFDLLLNISLYRGKLLRLKHFMLWNFLMGFCILNNLPTLIFSTTSFWIFQLWHIHLLSLLDFNLQQIKEIPSLLIFSQSLHFWIFLGFSSKCYHRAFSNTFYKHLFTRWNIIFL